MDPRFPSEQLSLPYNVPHDSSDAERGYLAYQQQTEPFSRNEYVPRDGVEYLSIQQSVPNTPNNQSQFNPQLPFPLNDFSHNQAHDLQHLDIDNAPGWGGPSLQTMPGETMNHSGPQGAFFSTAPQVSSSQAIDPAFSPSGDLYSPSRVQNLPPYATSFARGQVQDAAQSHVVTHAPNATTQAPQLREQKAQEKKAKDKLNKRDHRARNAQDFQSICALLQIPLKPKNWLPHRILEAVEELVEQREERSYLRDQLKLKEAEVDYLKSKYSKFD